MHRSVVTLSSCERESLGLVEPRSLSLHGAPPPRGPLAGAGQDQPQHGLLPARVGDRIKLIKRLQEKRFMPLKAIKLVLDRLAELEILTPNSRGYSPSEVKIIEAISRFRAGGYDEQIGFTVYDTLRYKEALEQLVHQEIEMVMTRLAGEVPPERVVEMLEAGAQPLKT
jgi:hypothetical protein